MTTIVMVQEEDDVVIGWDSLMTRGNESGVLVQTKFFENGGVVMGITGGVNAIDMLQYGDLPEYEGQPARKWLVTTWVPAVWEKVRSLPGLQDDEGQVNFGLLAVVDGEAFEFDSWLSPYQLVEGIYTSGSGADYARGALFAGADVMEALRIACRIDPYSGGPMFVTHASKYLTGTQESAAESGTLETPTG